MAKKGNQDGMKKMLIEILKPKANNKFHISVFSIKGKIPLRTNIKGIGNTAKKK